MMTFDLSPVFKRSHWGHTHTHGSLASILRHRSPLHHEVHTCRRSLTIPASKSSKFTRSQFKSSHRVTQQKDQKVHSKVLSKKVHRKRFTIFSPRLPQLQVTQQATFIQQPIRFNLLWPLTFLAYNLLNHRLLL